MGEEGGLETQQHGCPERKWGSMVSVSCPQDVDEVFQSKMDLEGNLESLREHVCFLTRLYEEVRTHEEQGEIRKEDRMDRLPVARRGPTRRGAYQNSFGLGPLII